MRHRPCSSFIGKVARFGLCAASRPIESLVPIIDSSISFTERSACVTRARVISPCMPRNVRTNSCAGVNSDRDQIPNSTGILRAALHGTSH